MSQRIPQTREYSKFECLSFNRDVEKIQLLETSMREHGWIEAYPMHVVKNGNGKLRIKAGHHRFEVAQKLGIPVKYVICKDTASVFQLERSTRPWKIHDYLTGHVREGSNRAYTELKRYYDRTGITLCQCVSMLGGESAGSHNMMEKFKAGTYEMGDMDHASVVAEIVDAIKQSGVKWATNQLLVNAISKIIWVPGFNRHHLKQKIKTFPYMIQKQPNVQSYTEMLEAIYNRQSQKKMPLAFLADKEAKRRNVVLKSNE